MADWRLACEACGWTEPLETTAWRCPRCGGAFGIDGPDLLVPEAIERADPTLWRYRAVLPVGREHARSLGEGMTPLVPGTLLGRPVRFKLDALLPTGSFKDRGAAVLVAHLRRLGLRRIVVDSSGNAAAAMAGYGAAGGLACTVYAPASTSPGKLVQSRAFGATVVPVEGTREDVAAAAQAAVAADPGAFYASHNWHPVFVEGVKTWLLEVWEQLGGRLPAACFIPTGGGSALVGAWRALQDLPGPVPALVAAQPAACAPIVAAVSERHAVEPVTPGATIAEGTRIGAPARPHQILAAVRGSSGWAEAVTDDEIVEALRELWGQGLYVEPTAAVGAAAFRRAMRSGRPLPDGEVVVLLTGSGLKATDTVARLLG
ncbi:MAG TPA: pyridoxal-phosphate dependent enzyme [Thermomicrobiaceae bacterium]|nr:pyridoxal-phosphate dependent enzyme [Thermomicrobiaceae bacterium]